MSGHATTTPAAVGTAAVLRRLAALSRLEARLLLRNGVVVVAAGLAAAWTVLLILLPASAARAVAPFLLLLDTATLGFGFLGALVLLERAEGTGDALAASPARFGERLAVRLVSLTALAVAAAVPIAVAGARGLAPLAGTLAGVTLTALLVLVVSYLVAVGQRTLTGFLTTAPLFMLPVLGIPLVRMTGLVDHVLLFAIPTTGTAEMITAAFGGEAPESRSMSIWTAAYALLWVAAGVVAVLRRQERRRTVGAATGHAAARRHEGSSRPRTAAVAARAPRVGTLLAFARTDLRNVRRDSLLGLVLFAPLLLLLAIRFGYPPLERWVEAEYGVSLAADRPLLLAFMIVLQLPFIFGMLGALLVLDDAEDRVLLAVRASPVTLERYLAYRLAAVTLVTFVALIVTVPLSGLIKGGVVGAVVPALVLAALLAPLVTLATTAFASNRVQGVAVIKAIAFPFHLPLLAWWLHGSAEVLVAVLPSYWPARALWLGVGGNPLPVVVAVGAAGLLTAVVSGVVLWRKVTARVTGA